MGLVTKPNTYTAGNTIVASEVTDNEDTLYTLVNGNIENANVKSSAGIVESKIAFNTSTGHNHDGSNSKLIPATLVWTVTGTLTVNTDPAPWIYISGSRTATNAIAVVKTASTGADIIVDIEKSSDNGSTWTSLWATTTANRLTIAASGVEDTQASFDTTALSAGDYVRIAVDQVGSSTAGADLQVFLVA